jgi:rod shape-determining protein MreC
MAVLIQTNKIKFILYERKPLPFSQISFIPNIKSDMNFLLRYGNFFLFAILEIFALYLVTHNKKQNEIYQSSANRITGFFYDNFSSVQKYLSIQELADSLAKENAELRTQLESSKYVAVQQRGVVRFPLDTSTIRPDTAQKKDVMQQFTYMAAEVIKNSIARQDNFLTVNRGSLHGVKQGMGVISPDGIVGIVTNVTPHYSQVMSILNKRASITAMLRRNRFFGSLVWHSNNPRVMTLESIPKYAEITKGDTIITSGFSEIFPGELKIGRVTDYRIENGSNFFTIDVELWNDLSNIRYVYIIENKLIEEMKTLNKEPTFGK